MAEFPKNYDHQEAEPRIQKFWEEVKLYAFDPKNPAAVFSVDTPPPYVSADHLHVGHGMSYSQAEFVVRYQRMRGRSIFYPMGFDDNGLPTERFVEKKYKINKNKISRKDFVERCLKETALGAETYRQLWRALGISVDWNLSYSTIDPHCQKTAQTSFLDLIEKGMIERREEPIIWCYQCQTSLAQADVDTEEKASALHDIAFSDPDGGDLIISTTRPELIPACVALYVNPDDARYRHLIGKEALVPLMDHRVKIRTDVAVDPAYGTGLMMVCTWGDMEDLRKWKEHELDTRLIFDASGKLNEKAGLLAGLYYTKAREAIIAKLKEAGLLRKTVSLSHHVGVHERCGTPIDFNLAPQWFIKTIVLRDELLARGDQLNWFPTFMKVRYEQWVRDLKWDWNISRQRYYGVPFPVWYCAACRQVILPKREALPIDPTVDAAPVKSCPSCQKTEIVADSDVMDTWMTSSLTPLIASQWANPPEHEKLQRVYPMSVRPQAFEIIRTWLFYTVLKSHLHTNSLPWTNVMISGWGLDQKGRKISKSLGNFVDAHGVIQKYSADALRYWAGGASLGHDLRYNESDVAAGRKIVVKLWNAIKFVDANLEKVDTSGVHGKNLGTKPPIMIDRWALSILQGTIQNATDGFENFEYSQALRAIERFFWQTYCDNYLEIVKDRFWNPEAYSAETLQSASQTLYVLSRSVLKLFAPFLPFITEELWQRVFREREQARSVHKASWPEIQEMFRDEQAEKSGNLLLSCLAPVRKYKSLEKLHQNHRLQEITVHAPENQHAELQLIIDDLKSAARAEKLSIAKPTPAKTLATDLENVTLTIT